MRWLDFETNLIKNPISGDDPGTNLARRWRNKVYYLGDWWRCYYWFAVFVFVYSCLCIVYWSYLQPNGILTLPDFLTSFMQISVMILPIIARLQMPTLPALFMVADSDEELWSHFRMILIKKTDLIRSMFFTSLNLSAIPLALVCVPSGLFILKTNNLVSSVTDYIVLGVLILVTHVLLGLILSAIGIAGALIKRSAGTVMLSVFGITLVTLLTAGPLYLRQFMDNLLTGLPYMPGTHPITLILMPSIRIAWTSSDMQLTGPMGLFPALDYAMVGILLSQLIITACVLWAGLYFAAQSKLK